MNEACKSTFLTPTVRGPGEVSKVRISLNIITKVRKRAAIRKRYNQAPHLSQFQRFLLPNFVYILIDNRYKTYQMGFLFWCLGHDHGCA